jgi:Zn-dependent protease with chaperone function
MPGPVADPAVLASFLPAGLAWWAGLPLVGVAFGVGWLVTAVAARMAFAARAWRALAEDAPWCERTRIGHPTRIVATFTPFLAGGVFAGVLSVVLGPAAALPRPALVGLAGFAGYAGGLVASLRWQRRLTGERMGLLAALGGAVGSVLVLAPIWVALAAMLLLVRAEWSLATFTGLAIGVAGTLAGGVWAGVPLARLLGLLRPASPRVAAAVARAAQATGVEPAAVFELGLPVANAAALPIPRWLFFTRRAVEGLSDAQIEAIAAHELGHVSEPAAVKATRVAGSLALLPVGAAIALIERFGPLYGLAAAYAGALAVALPVLLVRRRMEDRADAVAHGHEGEPGVYARALERLYRLNHMPAVGWRKRGVHAHLYDRLVAAGVEPGYPRPAPPSGVRLGAGIGSGALLLMATLPFLVVPRITLYALGLDVETRALASVALVGGTGHDFQNLGHLLAAEGRFADGAAALAVAEDLEPWRYDVTARRALYLASAGRCAEARGALATARAVARAQGVGDQDPCECLDDARLGVEACDVTAALDPR